MNVLLVISPLLLGGAVLGVIKGLEKYSNWRYRRAVERRNARQVRFGMVPFTGTKDRWQQ